MKIRSILPIGLLLWPLFAPAAVTLHYWTGNGGNGYWSNPNNWSGSVPNTSSHRVIFPSNVSKKSVTNNYIGGITVESVWIYGSGYNIANGLIRTDYLRASYPAGGSSTVRSALSTTGPLEVIVDNNNATLVVAGSINLNNDNLIISSVGLGDVTFQGVLSGTGGLYKNSTGDLRLSGLGANTFNGTTYVNGGILRLNRYTLSAGFILRGTTAIPGNLVIGSGTGGSIGDIVVLDRDHQIADTSTVYVHGSGSLELSGENDTIGNLFLRAGTVITGSGVLTLAGNVTTWDANESSIITGNLNLAGRSRCVFDIQSSADLHIPAIISGTSDTVLVKTNRGDLFFTGANTYSGDTVLQLGELVLQGGGRPGNSIGGTHLEGGRLRLWNSIQNGEQLTVDSIASLATSGSLNQWNGDVTLNATVQIETAMGSQLQINGAITGTGQVRKLGEGTLSYGGASDNTYTGTTSIQQGGFELAKPYTGQTWTAITGSLMIGNGDISPGLVLVRYLRGHQIADTSIVGLLYDATLDLNGFSDTLGNIIMRGGTISTLAGQLTLNGNININSSTTPAIISGHVELGHNPRTITVEDGPANLDLIFNTHTTGGPLGDLIKTGPGKVKITGDIGNFYLGQTIVNEGTLVLDKLPGLIAVPGDLIIGDGIGGFNVDIVELGESEQIADTSQIIIHSSGVLNLLNQDETIGSLTGNGTVALESAFLTNGFNHASTTFAGTLTGAGSLTKVGSGTFQLSGASAYTGITRVMAGTLQVDGILASMLTEVSAGTTLSGSGTVQSVLINPGANLSPGPGLALFTINGNLAMNQGALLNEISGSNSDQLQVTGSIDITDAQLQLSWNNPPAAGASFTLLNAMGSIAITGIFQGKPDSQTFMHMGNPFEITYIGGTGNDVVLTRMEAPPSEIQSITKDAQGGMVLAGSGLPGQQYVVEATFDLNPPAVWIQIGIVQADNNGTYQFTDPDAHLYNQRFYRVMTQ